MQPGMMMQPAMQPSMQVNTTTVVNNVTNVVAPPPDSLEITDELNKSWWTSSDIEVRS